MVPQVSSSRSKGWASHAFTRSQIISCTRCWGKLTNEGSPQGHCTWHCTWSFTFSSFSQVSEIAMAAVPELSSEVTAYHRSVGRLRLVPGPGLPFQECRIICTWRSDLTQSASVSSKQCSSQPGVVTHFLLQVSLRDSETTQTLFL